MIFRKLQSTFLWSRLAFRPWLFSWPFKLNRTTCLVFTWSVSPFSLTIRFLTQLSDRNRRDALPLLSRQGFWGIIIPTNGFFYWLVINADRKFRWIRSSYLMVAFSEIQHTWKNSSTFWTCPDSTSLPALAPFCLRLQQISLPLLDSYHHATGANHILTWLPFIRWKKSIIFYNHCPAGRFVFHFLSYTKRTGNRRIPMFVSVKWDIAVVVMVCCISTTVWHLGSTCINWSVNVIYWHVSVVFQIIYEMPAQSMLSIATFAAISKLWICWNHHVCCKSFTMVFWIPLHGNHRCLWYQHFAAISWRKTSAWGWIWISWITYQLLELVLLVALQSLHERFCCWVLLLELCFLTTGAGEEHGAGSCWASGAAAGATSWFCTSNIDGWSTVVWCFWNDSLCLVFLLLVLQLLELIEFSAAGQLVPSFIIFVYWLEQIDNDCLVHQLCHLVLLSGALAADCLSPPA